MKKAVISAATICFLMAALVFAQDGQRKKDADPALPDISKLHPLPVKRFFVFRGEKGILVKEDEKMEGDAQLGWIKAFSNDESSTEAAVYAIYPMGKEGPCALTWRTNEDITVFALFLEDGKEAKSEGGDIRLDPLFSKEEGGVFIGTRFVLVGDDKKDKIHRDFLIKR